MNKRTSLALILVLAALFSFPMWAGANGENDTWPASSTDAYLGLGPLNLAGPSLAGPLFASSPTATNTPPIHIRIKFEGTVTGIDNPQHPEVVTVEISPRSRELPVHTDNNTIIDEEHGPLIEGARVRVKAHLQWTENTSAFLIVADKIVVKDSPHTCRKIKFPGTLKEIRASEGDNQATWVITDRHHNDRDVLVTEGETEIEGEPYIGAQVQVTGCAKRDGTIEASKIKIRGRPHEGGERIEFQGCITAISNTQWTVGPWQVHIPEGIEIKGDTPDVGDRAQIKGQRIHENEVLADKIHVKGPCRRHE